MNLNSLIIVADDSRARLLRTAQTNMPEEPVELIEVDALQRSEEPGEASTSGRRDSGRPGATEGDALRKFAHQIANRAARFAEYHYCNPLIVAGELEVSSIVLDELGRELPGVYTRSLTGDVASLPLRDLMRDLLKRGAFEAAKYPCPA
jgi:protein required for attachment to host cells